MLSSRKPSCTTGDQLCAAVAAPAVQLVFDLDSIMPLAARSKDAQFFGGANGRGPWQRNGLGVAQIPFGRSRPESAASGFQCWPTEKRG